MTRLNFLMPRLAQPIRIVSQVLKIVFPVMGWLAKVMARNEKVMGFFAGFFSGICYELVPAACSIPPRCDTGRVQLIKSLCEDRRCGEERKSG